MVIGSNLVISLVKKYPNYNFINFDKLTYAGNLSNLLSIRAQKIMNLLKVICIIIMIFPKVFHLFKLMQ